MENPGTFADRLPYGGPEPGSISIRPGSGQAYLSTDRSERGMPRRLAGVIIGVIVLATFGYVIYASHVGQRGDHLLQEAETASNRGDYASAVRAFERLTTEYPNHAKIDEALYRLGFINRHFLNDPETALSAYERLVKVHGDSDSQWIQLAMQEIGDIHRSQQDYDKALEQYESIIAQFG
ncbi:MAG: tetratricopeptide repeat protein, partial [Armatimonadia bacterium]|nr:tetratricopeptide repeat protein [Armatimonadia bacterium]